MALDWPVEEEGDERARQEDVGRHGRDQGRPAAGDGKDAEAGRG